MSNGLFLGIDFGTSGCRAAVIDHEARLLAEANTLIEVPPRQGAMVEQHPDVWWQALCATLDALTQQISLEAVRSLAIDGTSGTLLLTDDTGRHVASRVLAPREYLQADKARGLINKGIEPSGEASITVYLDTSRTQASGYRLELFYPS